MRIDTDKIKWHKIKDSNGIEMTVVLKQDVDELAEQHGEWIPNGILGFPYKCSECNFYTTDISPYCPMCGSKNSKRKWFLDEAETD